MRRSRSYRLLAGIFLLLLLAPAQAQQERLEVIDLRYRSAEDLIPLLRPMLGSQGAITGLGNQLIVRATPDQLAQIRPVVQQLDTAPRQLLISVRQTGQEEAARTAVGASGSISTGSKANVIISGGQNTARRQDNTIQQVQVLDGGEAYIQVGTEVPRTQRYVTRNGLFAQEHTTTYYQPVTTGFAVRPRLSGDRVTLDIAPHRQRQSGQPGEVVESQHLATTVSGRVGEWLEIGGVNQTLQSQSGGLTYYDRTRAKQGQRILLKVDVLP